MAAELAALQAKYAQEAQKRLRPEGTAQFEELQRSGADRLRHLVDDMWADHAALDAAPPALRDGDRVKFLIAGAGMGGIVAAVRLVQAGFPADGIRLVETAGGAGGTWYWNRYPGLHCDCEAYVYMPLLEELGFVPSHKYASGVEIRNYLAQVLEKYGLADKVLFRARVERLMWDDAGRAWKADITARRGPGGKEEHRLAVEAQFPFLTAGVLQKPHVPKLGGVGLQGFGGAMLHTAMWDYGVTGGTCEEPFPALDKLRGKRVGIIGTGATAIQATPCLADYAGELYVFQRTPSAVYQRNQRATDPDEWATEIAPRPGWHRERLLNFASVTARCAPPGTKNMVNDVWTYQSAYSALTGDPEFALTPPEKVPEVIGRFLAMDEANRSALRAYTAEVVRDRDTAEKLTPWYPVWCKRPTFSDTYLQTFNRPNVHLVDTDGKGVEAATEHGLLVGGTEYPLDVLVLSTGYTSPAKDGGDPSVRAGVEVVGRGGRTLSAKWTEQGPTTLHGVATSGFPNLFWLGATQTGVSPNHSHVLETENTHIAHIIAEAHRRSGGLDKAGVTIEVEPEAEEAWSMRCAAGAARFAVQMICTPSYINNEGHMTDPNATQEDLLKKARQCPWSAGLPSYIEELERWRAEGSLSGIKFTVA
ncbi:hypothetical protein DL767_004991 [Monosporascus sp. MG133]|nr:hypothetical protein DL767_004991 [Monosporascus sp. MG133]